MQSIKNAEGQSNGHPPVDDSGNNQDYGNGNENQTE